jgi:hypothetical protein
MFDLLPESSLALLDTALVSLLETTQFTRIVLARSHTWKPFSLLDLPLQT